MTTRFSRWRNGANAFAALTLLSFLCAFLFAGCGKTGRESANSSSTGVTAVDETRVLQTLRTISTAEASFAVTNGGEYGMFEDLTGGGLLDKRFAGHTPELGGYVYTIKLAPGASDRTPMFAVFADPKTPTGGAQATGRHFYLDSMTNNIHVNGAQQAAASDPTYP